VPCKDNKRITTSKINVLISTDTDEYWARTYTVNLASDVKYDNYEKDISLEILNSDADVFLTSMFMI